jgi:ribonucleoside-triphosphate reductase
VTEVYSRITGYYRPVQNWNDGKSQEYKDRLNYDVVTKCEPHVTRPAAAAAEEAPVATSTENGILLLATKTCPNCKVAATLLEKAEIPYTKIYVEDRPELAEQFGIKQAPSLVVQQGGAVEVYTNLSNIKKFIES